MVDVQALERRLNTAGKYRPAYTLNRPSGGRSNTAPTALVEERVLSTRTFIPRPTGLCDLSKDPCYKCSKFGYIARYY